jgi:hypothetical protein
VTQDVKPVLGLAQDGADPAIYLKLEGHVPLLAVDQSGYRARLATVYILDDLASGGAAGILVRVIGAHVNRYHRHWTISVGCADDLLI